MHSADTASLISIGQSRTPVIRTAVYQGEHDLRTLCFGQLSMESLTQGIDNWRASLEARKVGMPEHHCFDQQDDALRALPRLSSRENRGQRMRSDCTRHTLSSQTTQALNRRFAPLTVAKADWDDHYSRD